MTEVVPLSPLSRRQRDALLVIQRYIREHGYPPTTREISEAMGIKSSSGIGAVADHLHRLEKKGYIRRDFKKSRGLKVLFRVDGTATGTAEGIRRVMSRCECGAVRFSHRCPPYIHEMMLKAERNDASCPGSP